MDILLLDSNINYCKDLMNAMSSLNKNIRISFIANSIKDILDTFDMDIILADYQFCDGELEIKFNPVPIIYLSDHYINDFETISKSNIDLIIQTIEKHSKAISDVYLEKCIISEISFLGYNFSLVGTQQLVEALKTLYKLNVDCYKTNLEKDIYPTIAKRFGIPVRTLKGNISYATNRMLDDCDKKKLSSYLGFRFSKRPGAKTVICALIENLKLKI